MLVPSYFSRERELLRQLEDVSSEVLVSVKGSVMIGESLEDMLQVLPAQLKDDSVILGGSLYSLDGTLLASFGEPPTIVPQQLLDDTVVRSRSNKGDRYDVAWPKSLFLDRYFLVIRHDSSGLKQQLMLYIVRIVGIVILISIMVTGMMLVVIERIAITPILNLREDFKLAGEVVGQEIIPQFHSQNVPKSDELGDVAIAFCRMFQHIHSEIFRRKEVERALRSEQEKSESLLLNILPLPIAEQLKQRQQAIAHRIDDATILFADLVDFTGLAAQIPPIELVEILNQIFSTFDRLAEQYGLEKIKTIGDAYMVVGGVTSPMSNHVEAVMELAIAMQSFMPTFRKGQYGPFHIRIGINSGPVVAGVIGVKKFSYDLWGDAVNIASRLESQGFVDKIHVSEITYGRVQHLYDFETRGDVYLKGRGTMKTYVLQGAKQCSSPRKFPSNSLLPNLNT